MSRQQRPIFGHMREEKREKEREPCINMWGCISNQWINCSNLGHHIACPGSLGMRKISRATQEAWWRSMLDTFGLDWPIEFPTLDVVEPGSRGSVPPPKTTCLTYLAAWQSILKRSSERPGAVGITAMDTREKLVGIGC